MSFRQKNILDCRTKPVSSITALVYLLLLFSVSNPSQATTEFNRSPALEGAENFRDFGGYIIKGNKKIRTGLLSRSNELSRLSHGDYQQIDTLGIRLVIDLRSKPEREHAPTQWSGSTTPERLSLEINPRINGRSTGDMAVSGGLADLPEPHIIDAMITDIYARLPIEFTHVIRPVIMSLADAQSLPVLVHCTAGKDRTGVVATIILTMLGVDEQTVMRDYLASNSYPLATSRDLAPPMQAIAGVKPEWLEATFSAIREEYGDFANYLKYGLAIDGDSMAKIRNNLVE